MKIEPWYFLDILFWLRAIFCWSNARKRALSACSYHFVRFLISGLNLHLVRFCSPTLAWVWIRPFFFFCFMQWWILNHTKDNGIACCK